MNHRHHMIILLALLCPAEVVWGQVTVRIEPPASTRALGEQFTVDIVADIPSPVLGWGIDVTIGDPAVVSLVGQPAIDAQWVPVFAPDGDGLAGAAFPNSISGNGVRLATLTLSADSLGETALTVSITADDLAEGFPLDPSEFAGVVYGSGLVVVSSALPPSCDDNNDCDDGLFCNGAEVCDASDICQFGTPACHDGVECTDDSCNEVNDTCSNVSNDGRCDDDFFCNGAETCDAQLGCLAGTAPCPPDYCIQASETCIDCLDDTDCDDGSVCTGVETCDEFGFCAAGIPLDCDDGELCTDDTCDPIAGCLNPPLVPCCGNQVTEEGEECDPPDGQTCDPNCMEPNCPGGGGDCYSPHASPGCDCLECCVLVCVLDPGCCDFEWDDVCSGKANMFGDGCRPICTEQTQMIMYVDEAAVGGNNGLTWIDAFNDLQDALALADCFCFGTNTPVEEIWVAQGTYVPTDCAVPGNCDDDDRLETFQLVNGIRILGGFPTGGAGPRDPDVYESILSGDLHDDDVGEDLQHTSRDENSVRVVTGNGTDETAVLDGFTITGGNADFCLPPDPKVACWTEGAGVYLGTGSATLAHCRIELNYADAAGAGVWGGGGNTLVSCSLTGNVSGGIGGGIRASGMNLEQCRLENNTANYGGGISNVGGTLTITNCVFRNNVATTTGGALYNKKSDPIIVNSLFANNSSGSVGGAIFNDQEFELSAPTLINCTLSGNETQATTGGGIYGGGKSSSEPMEIHNTILWGNIANGETDEAAQVSTSHEVNVTHSCIQDDVPLDGNIPFGGTSNNNIDADPQFVDPLGVPGILDPDFRLRPCSECIETGDNDVLPTDQYDLDGDEDTNETIPYDLDDNARIIDTDGDGIPVVDMGAYEHASSDCDQDGNPDDCLINDCNNNAIPDHCEPDCQPNGHPDDCDIELLSLDVNENGVPDECEALLVVEDATDSFAMALGLKVCRVYVQLGYPNADKGLLSVTNSFIESTDPFRGFWHHASGTDTAPLVFFCPADPEVCIDSFVTIGVLVNPGSDATTTDPDFDTTDFNSNGRVVGGWYNGSPSNGQGDPDLSLQVLIAQFTVRAKDGYGVSGDLTVTLDDGSSFPGLHFECFCITCPEDLDCDHVVGPSDLALLLGSWGPCVDCVADLDQSGAVGPFDLALLLGAWGPCP